MIEAKRISQPKRHYRAAELQRDTLVAVGTSGTSPQALYQEAHEDPFTDWALLPLPALHLQGAQASGLLCLQPLNKHAKNQETSLLSLSSVGTTSCIWLRAH